MNIFTTPTSGKRQEQNIIRNKLWLKIQSYECM